MIFFLLPTGDTTARDVFVVLAAIAALCLISMVGTFVYYWVSYPLFPGASYPLTQTMRSAGFELPLVVLCIEAGLVALGFLMSLIDKIIPK
jgi:hypothetical protein